MVVLAPTQLMIVISSECLNADVKHSSITKKTTQDALDSLALPRSTSKAHGVATPERWMSLHDDIAMLSSNQVRVASWF